MAARYTPRPMTTSDSAGAADAGSGPARVAGQAVTVQTASGAYDILIGAGLLDDPHSWSGLPASAHAVVVTNNVVGPMLAPRLLRAPASTPG